MFIILSGFPCSGKSVVADTIASECGGIVFRQDDLYPPNIHDLDIKEQNKIRISSWEATLDTCLEFISDIEYKDSTIVLDSCASVYGPYGPLIDAAKNNGHSTHFLYVDINLEKCEEISKLKYGKWIDDDIVSKYNIQFAESRPRFEVNCDAATTISNVEDKEFLVKSSLEYLRRIDGQSRIIQS